jgi:hypothetical protein
VSTSKLSGNASDVVASSLRVGMTHMFCDKTEFQTFWISNLKNFENPTNTTVG